MSPSTVPGTPLPALVYSDLPGTTLPESSKNISLLDLEGATSRWSIVKVVPSLLYPTRNPPPPIFPFPEDVTASAKPTATAASIAFPPLFNIWMPA